MSTKKPGRSLHTALVAPAFLFNSVARARSALYDKSALPVVDTGVPVISIGNITAGGTGKTPITSYLATDLATRGYSVGIVSRGYGGSEKGPALVGPDGTPSIAQRFGDEPAWLASRHPEATVVIGAKRPEAVAHLLTLKKPAVVLADDAFQHRRLKRDLDIVIVDPTEPRWHYQPLPLGRMREPFSALKRADFVFLSKTNLLPASELQWIRDRLKTEQTIAKFKIVEFGVKLAGVVSLELNRTLAPPAHESLSRVVLMSGIARPHTFEATVKASARVFGSPTVIHHFEFNDHHVYTQEDLKSVEERALAERADAIVITEKDAVKLGDWVPRVPVFVTRLTAEPLTNIQEFHEAVHRLLS